MRGGARGGSAKRSRGGGTSSSGDVLVVVGDPSSSMIITTSMDASSSEPLRQKPKITGVDTRRTTRGPPPQQQRESTNVDNNDPSLVAAAASSGSLSARSVPYGGGVVVHPQMSQPLPIDSHLLGCYGGFDQDALAELHQFFEINVRYGDHELARSLYMMSYSMRAAIESHQQVRNDFVIVNSRYDVLYAEKASNDEENRQLKVVFIHC